MLVSCCIIKENKHVNTGGRLPPVPATAWATVRAVWLEHQQFTLNPSCQWKGTAVSSIWPHQIRPLLLAFCEHESSSETLHPSTGLQKLPANPPLCQALLANCKHVLKDFRLDSTSRGWTRSRTAASIPAGLGTAQSI